MPPTRPRSRCCHHRAPQSKVMVDTAEKINYVFTCVFILEAALKVQGARGAACAQPAPGRGRGRQGTAGERMRTGTASAGQWAPMRAPPALLSPLRRPTPAAANPSPASWPASALRTTGRPGGTALTRCWWRAAWPTCSCRCSAAPSWGRSRCRRCCASCASRASSSSCAAQRWGAACRRRAGPPGPLHAPAAGGWGCAQRRVVAPTACSCGVLTPGVCAPQGVRSLFGTLIVSMPAFWNVGALLGLLFYIYAYIGARRTRGRGRHCQCLLSDAATHSQGASMARRIGLTPGSLAACPAAGTLLLGQVKHNGSLNSHANFERFWWSLLTLLRVRGHGRVRQLQPGAALRGESTPTPLHSPQLGAGGGRGSARAAQRNTAALAPPLRRSRPPTTGPTCMRPAWSG